MFYFQHMLNKLVKLVHIDIGKNLRSQIAERYPFIKKRECFTLSRKRADIRGITSHNFFYQSHQVNIFNFYSKNREKSYVVNRIKEFPHIAFQCIAWMRIVFAHHSNHVRYFFHSFMCSFTDSAGIGVVDECWLKYVIQNIEHCMVKHPISDCRLMNMPEFRIMNPKSFVLPVFVCSTFQIPVQVKIFRSISSSKDTTSGLFRLSDLNVSPRAKQSFGRNYKPV